MVDYKTAPIATDADLNSASAYLYGQEGVSPQTAKRFAVSTLMAQISAAVMGWKSYATLAVRNADSPPNGTIAYVYYNNGSATDAANKIYQRAGGAWMDAPWVVDMLEASILAKIEVGSAEITNILYSAGNIVATGILAGRSASTSDYATLAGYGAGYDITGSGYATALGPYCGENLLNCADAVLVGASCGRNAQNNARLVALGASAGSALVNSPDTVLLGNFTGQAANNIDFSVASGGSAMREALNSSHCVVSGPSAGYALTSSNYVVALGSNAAENGNNCPNSVMVGGSAGRFATNCEGAVLIGNQCGGGNAAAPFSTGDVANMQFAAGIGYAAFRYCYQSPYAVALGYAAGENANRSPSSTFLGLFAGIYARLSPDSVMAGHGAGLNGADSPRSVALGYFAMASEVTDSVYGTAMATPDGVFLGTEAGNPRVKSSPGTVGPIARGAEAPVCIGAQSTAAPASIKPVALGAEAQCLHDNSVALGADSVTTGEDQVMIGDRDIEVTDAIKGVVLKSPDGNRWRIKVADGGTLTVVAA